MKGKLAVLLVAGALMLVLGAGMVSAIILDCPDAVCAGTKGKDTLTGGAISNTIVGKNGADTINDILGADEDTIRGNKGNDRINVLEGNNSSSNTDFVNCGPGRDTLFKDSSDKQSGCERVNPL